MKKLAHQSEQKMKRRFALKMWGVSLVLGHGFGPAIAERVDGPSYETQVTIIEKKKSPKPKSPRPKPIPGAISGAKKTPSFPANLTLRIRISHTTSVPRFVLWSQHEGQFNQVVLSPERQQLDEYVAKLDKGMDPRKRYWLRVDLGSLSGEKIVQQPTVSNQELPVEVLLYPIVKAVITIENYDAYKPSTLSVGQSGSSPESLVPYPIDSNGIARFIKGIDPDLQHEIFVKDFAPIRIERELLRDGQLEKTIKLVAPAPPEPGGGATKSPGRDTSNIWNVLDVIMAVIILGTLVCVFLFGAWRLHYLRAESTVPQTAVRSTPPVPRRPPQVANSGSPSPGPIHEPGDYTEPVMVRESGAKAVAPLLNQPTEAQTYNVPLNLSRDGALRAYKSLIQNSSLSRQPLTVDIMLSDIPNKKGEQLKETMDPSSKFILFTDGHEKGWLFPNPAPSVRVTNVEQTWQLLFEGLSRDEFERKMERLLPIEASRNNTSGKILWSAKRQKSDFD